MASFFSDLYGRIIKFFLLLIIIAFLLALLPVLLVLIILFPGLRSKSVFNIWSGQHRRQAYQEQHNYNSTGNDDVVDVKATVVEDEPDRT